MRVAIVSDLVRPNGAGVMALLAADVLAEAGHDVAVIAGAMHADLCAHLNQSNRVARAFTHDEKALDGSVTATDHRAFVVSFGRWMAAEVESFEADLLYVHNCGRVLTQLDLAEWSRSLPVIHTMHDEWFYTDAHYTFAAGPGTPVVRTFEPGRSDSVLEHRYDQLFDVPDRAGNLTLVGPSEWLTRRAARVFPTLSTVHISNAVDTSMFDLQDRAEARRTLGLPRDRPIVLFVGNPTQERKGFLHYEQALRHSVGADGATPLRVVAGGTGSVATGRAAELLSDGPIRDRLAVFDANPIGNVDIKGDGIVVNGLDRTLMPALYGAADVLLHPSRIDNLPTVPIEAGLCGTRCLASDVGGTAETIADTADLFAPDLPAIELGALITTAIAEAAQESVADREARRTVQLQRFNVDAHRVRLLALLDRVMANDGVRT